jgi:integrase
MSVRLNRVDYRARLEPRREPRWHPLSKGRYVGFRRLTTATPGTWLARFYNGDGYKQKPLSDFATLPENERFDAAVAAAQEWFKHLDQGGSTERVTVKAACEAYAKWLRDERSESAARDAEGHFKRLVYGNPEKDIEPDPLARIELAKLRPEHVNAWRERIRKRGTETYFNRNLTTLRAALNKAKDDGLVAGDFAWSKALRPIKIGSKQGRRTLYLDRAQRRKLIEKASKELRPLLLAWILLPLRPGEIAKCRVEHIDLRHGILHVPEGKTESRDVPLGREAFEHLRGCAKNKQAAQRMAYIANRRKPVEEGSMARRAERSRYGRQATQSNSRLHAAPLHDHGSRHQWCKHLHRRED